MFHIISSTSCWFNKISIRIHQLLHLCLCICFLFSHPDGSSFCSTNLKFSKCMYICNIHMDIKYFLNVINIVHLAVLFFSCIYVNNIWFMLETYFFHECELVQYVHVYALLCHSHQCFTFGSYSGPYIITFIAFMSITPQIFVLENFMFYTTVFFCTMAVQKILTIS